MSLLNGGHFDIAFLRIKPLPSVLERLDQEIPGLSASHLVGRLGGGGIKSIVHEMVKSK